MVRQPETLAKPAPGQSNCLCLPRTSLWRHCHAGRILRQRLWHPVTLMAATFIQTARGLRELAQNNEFSASRLESLNENIGACGFEPQTPTVSKHEDES